MSEGMGLEKCGMMNAECRMEANMRDPPSFILHSSFCILHSARLLRLALAQVVHPRLARRGPLDQFAGLEEQAELALGGFGGVGAVDEVEGVADAEVAADGARLGLGAEGGAHHLAR